MRIKTRVAVGLASMLAGRAALAQTPRDSVEDERSYALAIVAIADSAIHRLDFFSDRAALRVQMAFTTADRGNATVPFDALASLAAAAASGIDEDTRRFTAIPVPPDLGRLHRDLTNSLRAATAAADRLAAAANACRASMVSVERCQSPFTMASTRLSRAYRDYLSIRAKIGTQILDTETHLAAFEAGRHDAPSYSSGAGQSVGSHTRPSSAHRRG